MKNTILAVLCLSLSIPSFANTGKEGSLERTVHNSTLLMNKLNPSIAKATVTSVSEVCDSTIDLADGSQVYDVCVTKGDGIAYSKNVGGSSYQFVLNNNLNDDFLIIPSTGSSFNVLSQTNNSFILECSDSLDCNIAFQLYGNLDPVDEAEVMTNLDSEFSFLLGLISRKAKAVSNTQIQRAKDSFLSASSANTKSYIDQAIVKIDTAFENATSQYNSYKFEISNTAEQNSIKLEESVNAFKEELAQINTDKSAEFNNKLNQESARVSEHIISTNKQNVDAKFDEILVKSKQSDIPPSNCGPNRIVGNWDGEKWICVPEQIAAGTVDMLNNRMTQSWYENIKSVTIMKDGRGRDIRGHVRLDFKEPISYTKDDIGVTAYIAYDRLADGDLTCRVTRYTSTYIQIALYKGKYVSPHGFCNFHISSH